MHEIREQALGVRRRALGRRARGDRRGGLRRGDARPRSGPARRPSPRLHLDAGQRVWLVTATPVEVAAVIAERLGLTGALGTVAESDRRRLHRPAGRASRCTARPRPWRSQALAEREGLDLAACSAYSDSANDIPMLSLVGQPVRDQPRRRAARPRPAHGWRIRDYRTGRKAAKVGVQAAAATALAGVLAAAAARRTGTLTSEPTPSRAVGARPLFEPAYRMWRRSPDKGADIGETVARGGLPSGLACSVAVDAAARGPSACRPVPDCPRAAHGCRCARTATTHGMRAATEASSPSLRVLLSVAGDAGTLRATAPATGRTTTARGRAGFGPGEAPQDFERIAALVELAQKGDAEAFGLLYERYVDPSTATSTCGSATTSSPRTSPARRSCGRCAGSTPSPGRAATSPPGSSPSPAT